MSTWQSYKCFGLNYKMLVIESLDADTETRRLSPVAILGDKYVDLINGMTLNSLLNLLFMHNFVFFFLHKHKHCVIHYVLRNFRILF